MMSSIFQACASVNSIFQGATQMKAKRTVCRFLFPAVLLGGWTLALAQEPAPQSSAPADNTKVNQRDRNTNEATADQQKDNRSDRDLTQQIRRSITKDKSLSTYAHNVKVITQNGHVTLKGPVRSEDEKKAVEMKAIEVAGADRVTSDLEIQAKN
jgi:hyperosmotically inducible periplasmic protein